MRSMLEKVERDDKCESRRHRKLETVEERLKRVNVVSQQRALFKQKEALKHDILRKRSSMERSLSQEILVSC